MRVAVIGAGAAGLCCARHLSRHPERFSVRVFEKSAEVGGTWVYSEFTGEDEFGLAAHSSMYKTLRTNLPKEIMPFQGFPFDPTLPSFPYHYDVLSYLQQFAAHYDLGKLIRFRTLVEQVEPVARESSSPLAGVYDSVQWKVTVLSHCGGSEERSSEIFDAVFVCNGHYFSPYSPSVPGLESFPGSVVHSHNYRDPEKYRGQRVLVIGAGPSGRDVAVDLSGPAGAVLMCTHGKPFQFKLPPKIELVADVESVDSEGTVHFVGGEKQTVDSIIVCTGYHYEFPFLSADCGVEVVDRRIAGLFKHTVNARHPSMALIGLNYRVVPFPYFDLQVQWVLAAWSGDKPLPSSQEMLLDSEEDYQQTLAHGMPPHYAHFLGPAQWDFFRELAELGGNEPLAPVIENLYTHVVALRRRDLGTYKKSEFAIVDDKNWVQVK